MPLWILALAALAVICALALVCLVAMRNAPLRDDMAEVDDHPHPEATPLHVVYYEGETPLADRLSA